MVLSQVLNNNLVPDCDLRGSKFKIFLEEACPQTPHSRDAHLHVHEHVFAPTIILLSSCYHPVWNPAYGYELPTWVQNRYNEQKVFGKNTLLKFLRVLLKPIKIPSTKYFCVQTSLLSPSGCIPRNYCNSVWWAIITLWDEAVNTGLLCIVCLNFATLPSHADAYLHPGATHTGD